MPREKLMKLTWLQHLYALVTILLLTTLSGAEDWSSCQDDLDRVKRAAQEASDAAEELDSKAREVEDKRSELQNCLTYPSMYDVWRDRCQSQRREYDYARQDYISKKRELESELSTLESRLRSVQSSCGYTFSFGGGPGRLPPSQKQAGFCTLLQSYKGKMSAATLLDICLKSMTEDECRSCLQ